MNAQHLLMKAKVDMVRRYPFYASLLMRAHVTFTDKVPTLAVGFRNDTRLGMWINPTFFEGLDVNTRVGALAHEVSHVALYHLGSRTSDLCGTNKQLRHLTNVAQDVVINDSLPPELVGEGWVTFESFCDGCRKLGYQGSIERHKSFEYYFNILKSLQPPNDSGEGGGEGGGEDGGDPLEGKFGDQFDEHNPDPGEGDDAPGASLPSEVVDQLAKEVAAQAMEEAKNAGTLPGSLVKAITEKLEPKVCWKRELKRFAARSVKVGKRSTRRRPNRRTGIHNPGKRAERKAKLLVAIDTSGSTAGAWPQFSSELDAIAKTTEVVVLTMDSKVRQVFTYKPGDHVDFEGGGGTSFQPLVNAIKSKEYRELRGIDGVVFLTDTYGRMPDSNARLPWLWVTLERGQLTNVPFGKGITLGD